MKYRTPVACVSGGFDPAHVGHLRYIQNAREYGEVVVILNSDSWLLRKKGYVFMPFDQRREMLLGMRGIKEVVSVDDSDGSVCKALIDIKPNFFCNGGDRIDGNTPEKEVCESLGITMVFGVGGDDKVQASSRLVESAIQSKLESHGIVRGI